MKNRTTTRLQDKVVVKKRINPSKKVKAAAGNQPTVSDSLFGSPRKAEVDAMQMVLRRNELLRLASRVAKLGYFELDRKTFQMNWSSQLLDIFEIKKGCEPLLGADNCDYIFAEDYLQVLEAFKKASAGIYKSVIYRITTQSGKVKTLRTTFSGVQKKIGEDLVFGTTQDISEITEKETEILNKEKDLQSIADSAPVMILKTSVNGTIQYANADQKKRIGKKVFGIFHASSRKELQQKVNLTIKTGKTISFEIKGASASKKAIWYHTSIRRIDYANKSSSLIFIVQDISGLKEVKQLVSDAIAEAEMKERNRIAADLHDGVCQHLATIHLSIDTLQKMIRENEPGLEQFIAETKSLAAETLSMARKASHDLMPVDVLDSGFLKGIKAVISRLNRVDKIKYNLTVLGKEKKLQTSVSNNLYRVVQEFIHNSEKHSEATEIKIHIRYAARELKLTISDNGKGFNPDKIKKTEGIGLQNMINRIRTFTNQYEYRAAEGKGVSLSISIPL